MKTTEKIIGILSELSAQETIRAEHTLREDLTLDSLAMVMLLVEIEDVFDIQLAESDMNPFDLLTVQDVINMVERYGGDSIA